MYLSFQILIWPYSLKIVKESIPLTRSINSYDDVLGTNQRGKWRELGECVTDLSESGGEGNKESGGGPKESTEGDDVGTVMARGEVRGDGVARGLNDGSEESEGTKSRWVSVKCRTHFLVHTR